MNYIFIIGTPRSGGTLLYNILCNDSEINPPVPENHLINDIGNIYFNISERFEIEKNYFFDNKEDLRKLCRSWAISFLEKIRKRYNNPKKIIIKSFPMTANFNIIFDLIPESHFIFTVRDPRDVIASMIRVGEEQQKATMENKFPRDINYLSKRVNLYHRILFSEVFTKKNSLLKKSTTIIKYEEVVTNPKSIISGVNKKLGTNINLKNTNEIWKRSDYIYNESKRFGFSSKHWGMPITSKTIGSYKNVLNSDEINLVNDQCKEIMNFFNYN